MLAEQDSRVKHGCSGESRRQSHTAVLSQLDEQEEEENDEMNRPTSTNTNDSETEDIFLNQESSDEAAELNHPYQPSAECFETSRSMRRTDNHFLRQNNMSKYFRSGK